MQNVPKIVRERLRAATSPADNPSANLLSANHPDADALTAFAERSLPERERVVLLEHLARCGDCRDIMALALPASEPVEAVKAAPPRGWLTWPVLRWGLVAAGVVAIASLGIVRYQRRLENTASRSRASVEVAANQTANQNQAANQNQTDQNKDQSSAPPVSSGMAKKADNIQVPSAFAGSAGANDSGIYDKKSTPRAMVQRVPAPQSPAESVHGNALLVGRALPHGPLLANQLQQQNTIQNQAPVPATSSPFAKQQAAGDLTANMRVQAPSETESLEVENQSAQVETNAQNLDAAQMKDLPAAPPPPTEDYASARIGKAKPAVTAQTGSAGKLSSAAATAAPAPAQGSGGAILTPTAPVPRWTINSTGGLQRSFDQGVTWQAVDVNANLPYLTDAKSVQVRGETTRAKSKDTGPAFKRDAASPTFRAVAVTGIDVWAGGSASVLYHSPDSGDHWTRVTPTSSGTMLTGDIVSLEFPDTQHGKVSTSTAEVWTTSDAGQTWQKQ